MMGGTKEGHDGRERKSMRSSVIHIHFYERGRCVAHNRDVEYSPMH